MMMIMANLPLTWNLLFFVLLGTQIAAVTGTINPDEPFIAWGIQVPNQVAVAPLDTMDFTTISVPGVYAIYDLTYDPVEQKLYICDTLGIYRTKLDGTEFEKIIEVGANGIAIDPDTRKMFFLGGNTLYMSNFDGSNKTTIASINGNLNSLVRVDSRIYAAHLGPISGLFCYDSSNGDYLPEEDYSMTDVEFIRAPAFDVAGGQLYWTPNESARIYRQAIDDINSTCPQTITNINKDLEDQGNPNTYIVWDVQFHQDYIYMATTPAYGGIPTSTPLSGLIRIHKSGAGAFEDVGDYEVSKLREGAAKGLYIHDPARKATEQGFVGGVLKEELRGVNYTTPVNVTFPVTDYTKWFGGMIIDLVIPITGPIGDWHLDISFPRRIYKLEIQGCDAEISDVIQRQYGRRKGTDYVIIPGPNNRSPPPGEDLTIRFVVKVWKDVRGMKRGITAHFVPVSDIFECDPPAPSK